MLLGFAHKKQIVLVLKEKKKKKKNFLVWFSTEINVLMTWHEYFGWGGGV